MDCLPACRCSVRDWRVQAWALSLSRLGAAGQQPAETWQGDGQTAKGPQARTPGAHGGKAYMHDSVGIPIGVLERIAPAPARAQQATSPPKRTYADIPRITSVDDHLKQHTTSSFCITLYYSVLCSKPGVTDAKGLGPISCRVHTQTPYEYASIVHKYHAAFLRSN